MATFEERNPYVTATPKVSKKKPVKYTGLLGSQDQQDETGLLGESMTPQTEASYNQGLLSRDAQQANYNALYRQYVQNYIRQMQAQQEDAQQKKMEEGMAKSAVRYAKNTAAADKAASAPGGADNIGSGIAGNNAAQDAGYETMDTANYNDQAATFDDAGGAEATNSDSASGNSDSGGSYVGAATGALAGYGAGKKNYYTDPAMRDKKDGFGTYHRDHRAELGGGTLGGVIGYFSNGYATPLVNSIVDWFHPYAQDMTRDAIMLGDRAGGAYGAMMMDPAGTWASGKYSNSDLVASSLTPLFSPVAGGKAPEIAQKASDPISKIGNSIADVFGW